MEKKSKTNWGRIDLMLTDSVMNLKKSYALIGLAQSVYAIFLSGKKLTVCAKTLLEKRKS